MEKIMIAAVADDLAIGRDNALLWHISADMKYFRRTTMGCPVIMGFRTWESIGRPLPGRLNIVITRHHFDAPDTVLQVPDVATAFAEAEKHFSSAGTVPEKCFIMGGAKTYERSMQYADALYITHVHTTVPEADAFFPAIDPAIWEKTSDTDIETDPENGFGYSFAVYRRR
ncbi:MAG: dihydrofolate reductase [Candidatus Cryptobacteroides sp.]|nr:dihydrofolate reductase [Candidatus Cryptobacteroides sp.]